MSAAAPYRSPRIRRSILLSTLVGCILATARPAVSPARIFLRTGSSKNMIEPAHLGWREAFRGDLEMDGSPLATQIFSTGSGARSSLGQIEAFFRNRDAQFAGGSGGELGWGIALWPDRTAHVLVLAPRAIGTTLVFVFHRGSSARPKPRDDLLDGLPAYPGSRLSRTVERSESGLRLGFFGTPASEAEVLDFYEGALPGYGWRPLISDRNGRALPRSVLFYRKAGRVCCISVKTTGSGRENLITILMKDS